MLMHQRRYVRQEDLDPCLSLLLLKLVLYVPPSFFSSPSPSSSLPSSLFLVIN